MPQSLFSAHGRRTLSRKLLLPASIFSGLFIALSLALAGHLIKAEYLMDELAQAKESANTVRSAHLAATSTTQLQRFISAYSTSRHIRSIAVVVGSPPQVIAASRNALIGGELSEAIKGFAPSDLKPELSPQDLLLQSSEGTRYLMTYAGEAFGIAQRTKADRAAVYVEIYDWDGRHGEHVIASTAIVLLISGLGMLIAIFFALQKTHVLDPLARLEQFIVSTAAFEAPEGQTNSDDEISRLARTFNQGIRQIQNQNRALKESESRLHQALQAIKGYIWTWNLNTNSIQRSQEWEVMTGLAADSVAFADGIDASQRVAAVQKAFDLRDSLLSGERDNTRFEHKVICADGSTKWFLSIGNLLNNHSKNDSLQIAGVSFDITEVKSLRDAETMNRARLATALEAARGGAWEWNIPEQKFRFSPEWARRLGYEPSDFDGNVKNFKANIESKIHPEDADAVARRVSDGLKFNLQEFNSEHRIKLKHGGYIWVLDRGRVVERDSRGNPSLILGVQIDITDRKLLQEQLEQSSKLSAIGQLTGGVAHDLNNMLAVILGSAELIDEAVPKESRLDQLTQRILQAVHRGSDLIRRLLVFARKAETNPEVIDLGQEVGEYVKMVGDTIGPGIKIDYDRPSEVIAVKVDRVLLETCFLNLCINARDAMPNGGSIRAAVELQQQRDNVCQRDWAVLKVSDQGIGMSADVKAHIFEPFFSTKPKGNGTGLGLAMVHGFIAQSGGRIDVESEVGRGSSFIIRLPISDQIPASSQPKLDKAVQRLPAEFKVLIVEDNRAVRETLREQLEAAGGTVVEAESVEEAQAILEGSLGIGFCVCDFDLGPGLSGSDLAEWVKRSKLSIPGIILTGYPASAGGPGEDLAWKVVSKPIAASALVEMIIRPQPVNRSA